MTVFDYMNVTAKYNYSTKAVDITITTSSGFYNSIPSQTSAGYFNGQVRFDGRLSTGQTGSTTVWADDNKTYSFSIPSSDVPDSVTITVYAGYSQTGPLSESQSSDTGQ